MEEFEVEAIKTGYRRLLLTSGVSAEENIIANGYEIDKICKWGFLSKWKYFKRT